MMFSFYTYLLLFIFALIYTKATLFWLYLWQLKEYRLDRFWAEYGSFEKILRFWIFAGGRRFWQPKWTAKTMIVVISALAIAGVTVAAGMKRAGNLELGIGGLVLLYLLVPVIMALIVIIFRIPTFLVKLAIYKKAARRITSLPELITIGITGSYGKSSTKEFLAQILGKKFKVKKTPENVNTEIGVAKYILQHIDTEDEIFIVEMGAYKIGEIKKICEIVKPKIGMITGINEQHLALFGSLENIMKAKYELIECLPEDGLAVFNGENKYCLEMVERWSGKKVVYRATKYENVRIYENPPKHYILNLLGAIEVARHLGMSEEKINEAVKNIKLTDKMMKTFVGRGGALIIDDTYSANPDGVLVALDYLAEQKQSTKIIVMPCLIELGEAAEEIHRKIGKKIGEICDLAIITTSEYFDVIKQEVGDKAVLAVQPERAIELLEDKLGSDTAVLLEGRLLQEIVDFLQG